MNKARTIRVIVIVQLDQVTICLITAAPNPKTPNSSTPKPAQAKPKKPLKAKTETLSTPPPPPNKAPVTPNTDPRRSTEARRFSEYPENPTPTKNEPTPFEFQKKNYSSFQRGFYSLKMSRLKFLRAVRTTSKKSSG